MLALAESLPEEWRTGRICDPQILLQFPHLGDAITMTPDLPHSGGVNHTGFAVLRVYFRCLADGR